MIDFENVGQDFSENVYKYKSGLIIFLFSELSGERMRILWWSTFVFLLMVTNVYGNSRFQRYLEPFEEFKVRAFTGSLIKSGDDLLQNLN